MTRYIYVIERASDGKFLMVSNIAYVSFEVCERMAKLLVDGHWTYRVVPVYSEIVIE